MFKLAIDEAKCTGCRACELACSFRHHRGFNPRIASIEINRQGKGEVISILIISKDLLEEKAGHLPCDGCNGEDEPMCVKYCAEGAIQLTP